MTSAPIAPDRSRRPFALAVATALVTLFAAAAPAEVWCVTGTAKASDPVQAAKTAARKAKESMGERSPALVLMFECAAKTDEDRRKLVAALGESFDPSLVYGCRTRDAAIGPDGTDASVSLLALGGDLKVNAVKAAADAGKWAAAGKALGEGLKPAYDAAAAAKGRVVLLYAQGGKSSLQQLVNGLTGVLGLEAPITGGATIGTIYDQGAASGENLALLLSGDFTVGLAMGAGLPKDKDMEVQDPASVIQSAVDTTRAAVGENPDDVVALLVCNCISRRGPAAKAGPNAELQAYKSVTPAPVAGFYGEAEAGPAASGEAAVAESFHISACALRAASTARPQTAAVSRETATVLDPASTRAKLLGQLGLQLSPCPDVRQAFAATTNGLVVADASPGTLKTLADDPAALKAFTARGGWLMLWGLTPAGLVDFNRIVGVDQLLRPHANEDVHLPANPDPLMKRVDGFNVLMNGTKRGLQGMPLRADDVWSFVLDYDDIAPFSTLPSSTDWYPAQTNIDARSDHYARNMVNGFDDDWRTSFTFPMTTPKDLKWTFAFPRAEEVTGFSLTPDTIYHTIGKLRLTFTGSDAGPVELDVRPELIRQDFDLPGIKATGLTVEILQMTESKASVTGIRNVWIRVKRSDAFRAKVKPLLNIGVLVKYPMGQGGVIVNQMQILDGVITDENRLKQKAILGTLLRNLGAHRASSMHGPRVVSDWPQWRGPDRNSISPETGLALDWGLAPPQPLWMVNVGIGYASFAAVGDRVYTLGWSWRTGQDTFWCLNAETGEVVWKHSYPAASACWLDVGRGHIPQFMGPRATPAVDGDRVYSMAADGQTFCFHAGTGEVLWRRDLLKDGDAHPHREWFLAGSPLVIGNALILSAGGAGIAVDKMTGKTLWTSGAETAGLPSPVPYVQAGRTLLLSRSSNRLLSLDPADGKVVWSYGWGASYGSTDPVLAGTNVLLCGAYEKSTAMIPLGGTKPVWTGSMLLPECATPIFSQGYVYSQHGYCGGQLICLDPKDGAVKWTGKEPFAFEQQILADGKIILQDRDGAVCVYDASPEACVFRGSYKAPAQKRIHDYWYTLPALAHGRLFIRSWGGDAIALDIRADAPEGIGKPLRPTVTSLGPTWIERTVPDHAKAAFQKPAPTDWAQWRGPNRDGCASAKDLALDWTATPPRVLWRVDVGYGFSTPVGAGDRLYTMGYRYREADGVVYVACLDARTGNRIWLHPYGPRETGVVLDKQRGDMPVCFGPRATPALDGDRLFTLDQAGNALCLDAASGKVVWQKSLMKDFAVDHPPYWFAGSPLVLDKTVVFGAGAAGLALDKATGAVAWTNGTTAAGQAAPVAFECHGRKWLAVAGKDRFCAVDPSDGKIDWSTPWPGTNGVISADAVPVGDKLLLSGDAAGCALLAIGADQPQWRRPELNAQMATPILCDGFLYGPNRNDEFVCLDAKDGAVKWRQKMDATQVTLAEGKLLIQCRHGEVVVAEASPTGFKTLGRVQALDSDECWSPPVVIGGRLYCRGWEGALAAIDISGN